MGKKRRSLGFTQTRIEALVVANHVEASQGGLVYISGAGWVICNRPMTPDGQRPPSAIGVAVFLYVPWNDTNRPIGLTVRVEGADGEVVTASPKIPIPIGRPSDLPLGSAQYPAVAANLLVNFPKAGSYRIVAELDGSSEVRVWEFFVRDLPPQQAAA